MSEINFINSAKQGDIIELGIKATHFGTTSITLTCEVRNKITHKTILTVDKIVFVSLDENGKPKHMGGPRYFIRTKDCVRINNKDN